MLAIAAVTLSTMHQSSLGSLFLLMPDKLAPQWWSPVMPISFFLSSIAAGTSLVILVEMWIAKAWGRRFKSRNWQQWVKSHFGRSCAIGLFDSAIWPFEASSPTHFREGSESFSRWNSSLAAFFLWSCLAGHRCERARAVLFLGALLTALAWFSIA